MEARNRTIEDWFAWIRDGAVMLPRFQRFEAWGFAQVEGILENIVRRPALPVGALLILEVGDEPPFHARPISGAPTPQTRPAYHLLDGQQRLTALWRSLTDDYEEVTSRRPRLRPCGATSGAASAIPAGATTPCRYGGAVCCRCRSSCPARRTARS